MRREQLEHLLRAASTVVGERDILVIGSQSILGTFPDADLPLEATTSIEADLAFLDDPADEKADQVDGAIGELSKFHETYGYYAQGVSVACRRHRRRWFPAAVAARFMVALHAGPGIPRGGSIGTGRSSSTTCPGISSRGSRLVWRADDMSAIRPTAAGPTRGD